DLGREEICKDENGIRDVASAIAVRIAADEGLGLPNPDGVESPRGLECFMPGSDHVPYRRFDAKPILVPERSQYGIRTVGDQGLQLHFQDALSPLGLEDHLLVRIEDDGRDGPASA